MSLFLPQVSIDILAWIGRNSLSEHARMLLEMPCIYLSEALQLIPFWQQS